MSFNAIGALNHILLQVGQNHTAQYHAGANVGNDRHGFVKEDGTGHNGGQRIQISKKEATMPKKRALP